MATLPYNIWQQIAGLHPEWFRGTGGALNQPTVLQNLSAAGYSPGQSINLDAFTDSFRQSVLGEAARFGYNPNATPAPTTTPPPPTALEQYNQNQQTPWLPNKLEILDPVPNAPCAPAPNIPAKALPNAIAFWLPVLAAPMPVRPCSLF